MADMTEEEWVRLTDDLLRKTRGMEVARSNHMSKLDLRGEPAVMHLLHHHPEGLTPTQIAEKTHVSTARIAVTLNGLEQRGLVSRQGDPRDRRRVIVRTTPEGEDYLHKRFSVLFGRVEATLKQLGPDDARELVRLMGRLGQIVGAEPPDGMHSYEPASTRPERDEVPCD